jgi:hypothetical protein
MSDAIVGRQCLQKDFGTVKGYRAVERFGDVEIAG